MSLHRKLNVKIFSYVYRSRKHWECKYYLMLFKIFLKNTKLCENYCQTQWSKTVLSGGSSPLQPYRNTTVMGERVQYPKCAYDSYGICIGLTSETARNGQYKRLTEKMRVVGRKTEDQTPLNVIPVHKNTYFDIKSVAKSLV